jgi:hypothetical protein
MGLTTKEVLINFVLPAAAAVAGGVALIYVRNKLEIPMGDVKKFQVMQ